MSKYILHKRFAPIHQSYRIIQCNTSYIINSYPLSVKLSVLFAQDTIYQEENKLKEMAADERLSAREATVAPKVDAFFEYVHFLESSDGVFSDRMKKTIISAVN